MQREILAARREQDGEILWAPDASRLTRIAVKLARGLVDFELNEPQLHDPEGLALTPLLLMSDDDRRFFEGQPGGFALWPELGSRAFHRVLFGPEDSWVNGWIVVQRDRFRYRVTQEDGMRIRMVIREYPAIDVVLW